MIEKAVSKGVRVYAKTKINGKILKENQTQLFIETGHTVHAQTVIFATGYEAQEEVKDKNAVFLSSYAIATNQIADQAKWHDNMIFGKRNGLIYMQEKLLTIELSFVALMNRAVIWRKGIQ